MNESPASGMAVKLKPLAEPRAQIVNNLRSRRWRALYAIPAIFALFFVTFSLAVLIFPQRMLTVDSGPVKGDVLVLLGGTPEGRPERTAELFREGVAPKVLIVGFGDAPNYARTLEQLGVPAEVIWLETRSKSTYENALFSEPILKRLGAKKVIIVTSWYHSRRALACFQHTNPNLCIYIRPSYADYEYMHWGPYRSVRRVALEYVKILFYTAAYGVWSYWP
jgi:uncharacterized SAM-binding protein YcdF (DUF218 family)